jgi:2'-5' RNA ligase
MRLFVAVPVPDKVSGHLRKLQNLAGCRASFPKEFHCTLRFLGETGEQDLSSIRKQLSFISFSSFDVRLDKTGFFPNEKKISVVWVGMQPAAPLIALQQKVSSALGGIGDDEKEFSPHLTIARIKEVSDRPALMDSIRVISPEPLSWKVDEILLVESILTSNGAEYRVLLSVKAKE